MLSGSGWAIKYIDLTYMSHYSSLNKHAQTIKNYVDIGKTYQAKGFSKCEL